MSHPTFAFFCPNTFCGFFIRGIHEINPKDSGNVPSGMQTAVKYRMFPVCRRRSDCCPTALPLNITTEHPAHLLQRCVPACCRSHRDKGKKKQYRATRQFVSLMDHCCFCTSMFSISPPFVWSQLLRPWQKQFFVSGSSLFPVPLWHHFFPAEGRFFVCQISKS